MGSTLTAHNLSHCVNFAAALLHGNECVELRVYMLKCFVSTTFQQFLFYNIALYVRDLLS